MSLICFQIADCHPPQLTVM